jgi:predicted DNA-binding transcriptional regulator AlpA
MMTKENMIMDRLLGINELSRLLGLAPQTIRNKLNNGTFPIQGFKVCGRWRWKESKVNKHIDGLEALYGKDWGRELVSIDREGSSGR